MILLAFLIEISRKVIKSFHLQKKVLVELEEAAMQNSHYTRNQANLEAHGYLNLFILTTMFISC